MLMNSKDYMTKTFLLVALVVLSSCQKSLKPRETFSNWKQVSTWSVKGKMAIRNDNERGSGKFSWFVHDSEITAQFSAPLGQGSWKITEDKHSAKLTSSEHGNIFGNNAEDLISAELGWHFPWNSLEYWLRGYETSQKLKSHNTLPDSFIDNSWEVIYEKWMPTPIGMLPKKIKARRSPHEVTVVIYDWNLQ